MSGERETIQVQAAKLAPSLYMAFTMWDRARRRICGLESVGHQRWTQLEPAESERWEALALLALMGGPFDRPKPRRKMEER